MRLKRIQGAFLEWPEAEYGLYNFQRKSWLDQALELLTTGCGPRVFLLAGMEAIGRSYFLNATQFRMAREHGEDLALWHLDLEGFEPDGEDPLSRYLLHLLEDEERRTKEQREKTHNALKTLARTLSKTDWSAAILSFLWQFEDPLKRFGEILATPKQGYSGAERSEREMLQMLLDELTQKRKLLLHVTDCTQIRESYRRWLATQVVRNRNLFLAISCRPEDTTDQLVPVNLLPEDPLRFDFEPLDHGLLQEALESRFEPGACPAELVNALLRYSAGFPARVALKMLDLVKLGAISDMPPDGEEILWHLGVEGLASQALAKGFAADFYTPIEKLIAGMPRLGRELREFLALAALCRRNVPAALLFTKLDLSEDEADELMDVIDDHLVDELGLFFDLGQKHPAFPGLFIYQFCDPIMPGVILEQVNPINREMEAASLMPFLQDRLPVRRREVARLFLAVTTHLGDREQRAYRRQLEWWIGSDEAEQLKPKVQAEIESGDLEPDLIWIFLKSSQDWPAYRRMALLDAYIDAQVSKDETHAFSYERAFSVYMLRGRLLLEQGRFGELLSQANAILKAVEPQTTAEVKGLLLAGISLAGLGELEMSSRHLKRAFQQSRELLGSSDMLTVSIMGALASTRYKQGEFKEAQEQQELVLAMTRRILGEEHPHTMTAMNNLALSLKALGDVEGAGELHEATLAIRWRVQGEEHPDTMASMNNLALTLRALGDNEGARELQEPLLALNRRILGEEHPHTMTSMSNLASTLEAQGDAEGARALHEATLAVRQQVLGDEHLDTVTSMSDLAQTLRALGNAEGARELQEAALAIRRRVLGDEHPEAIKSMNNLAVTLGALGDNEGARELQESVLVMSRQVLGEEHKGTMTSMSNLASTLRVLGDNKGARALHEAALAVRRRVLGDEHLDTMASMYSLASTLRALGDTEGARELYEALLAVRQRVLGDEHPDTMASMYSLASTLRALGDTERARELRKAALAVSQRSKPSTMNSRCHSRKRRGRSS